MSALRLALATEADVDALAALVRAYHAGEGIESDIAELPSVLRPLLNDATKGRAWFIEHEGAVVGYVAICFGYSIEFGGVDAFVDEIYLAPSHRGRGLGTRALALAIDAARELGAHALHLEVDPANPAAMRLYRSAGFGDRRYRLMTLRFVDGASAKTSART